MTEMGQQYTLGQRGPTANCAETGPSDMGCGPNDFGSLRQYQCHKAFFMMIHRSRTPSNPGAQLHESRG
jgi:hypothetical protein